MVLISISATSHLAPVESWRSRSDGANKTTSAKKERKRKWPEPEATKTDPLNTFAAPQNSVRKDHEQNRRQRDDLWQSPTLIRTGSDSLLAEWSRELQTDHHGDRLINETKGFHLNRMLQITN